MGRESEWSISIGVVDLVGFRRTRNFLVSVLSKMFPVCCALVEERRRLDSLMLRGGGASVDLRGCGFEKAS